ncbi:hypothetical protein LTR36_010471 [Oleoguttula mirabilis]|uniref:Transcription initiation factor TFIID subunit 8 n=1 Tax=Oleoguttula mirabilis TaxID=1507867 RepID=A0AAV9J5N9_9PEZI|nr:hypothetical protein LTR36_010471 [Oleoguttula mirabilis]
MAEMLPRASTKRLHSSTTEQQPAHKKRRLHRLQHVQHMPQHIESAPQGGCAPQGPDFTREQLHKSIGAALVMAGFDAARPEALEMLKTHTEEYMLHFAQNVRSSMQGGRRVRPTAPDFSMALSLMPNTSTASLLKPQLGLQVPESISYPSIPEPELADDQAADLSGLLQPLSTLRPPTYIPKHFPPLPPKHTWMETPVYIEREKDARKMRELMTQEGMLAEQALRKLATAAKASALNAERKKSHALSGPGKARNGKKLERRDDGFADVLKDIGGQDDAMGMEGANDAIAQDGIDVLMPEGVAVNYDMGHWRHGRKTLRL